MSQDDDLAVANRLTSFEHHNKHQRSGFGGRGIVVISSILLVVVRAPAYRAIWLCR